MKAEPKALLEIIRPVNCFMMGLAVIVGVFLALGRTIELAYWKLAAGFLTGFLLTASSMVSNDYADREIDAVNAPQRPIPRGAVGSREALTYFIILAFLGLAASILTGLTTFLIALASFLSALAYNFYGKKTGLPGNFLVSFNVAVPILYGAALAGFFSTRILVFWAMILLSNTSREVIKDIADVEGDRVKGVRSLAIVFGEKPAALIAAILIIVAVLLSPIPILQSVVSPLYMIVAVTDIGFVYSTAKLLRILSRETALEVKKEYLTWMLIGLIAFLAGSLGYP